MNAPPARTSGPPGPNAPRSNARPRELRCECGSLMARVTREGIELKCRRCKRAVLLPLQPAP
jgi:hypothetical protein